jgi:predicted transcriptional regulator
VDWFANSLPGEGRDADKATVADLARRDVPACRLSDTVADVRDRIGDWDICVVVDDNWVVLGVLRGETPGMDEARRVDDLMQEGPMTHRPDVTVAEMAEMLGTKPESRVLVTNADGTLVGVANPDDIERSAKEFADG